MISCLLVWYIPFLIFLPLSFLFLFSYFSTCFISISFSPFWSIPFLTSQISRPHAINFLISSRFLLLAVFSPSYLLLTFIFSPVISCFFVVVSSFSRAVSFISFPSFLHRRGLFFSCFLSSSSPPRSYSLPVSASPRYMLEGEGSLRMPIIPSLQPLPGGQRTESVSEVKVEKKIMMIKITNAKSTRYWCTWFVSNLITVTIQPLGRTQGWPHEGRTWHQWREWNIQGGSGDTIRTVFTNKMRRLNPNPCHFFNVTDVRSVKTVSSHMLLHAWQMFSDTFHVWYIL